jgi:hypothetical protein
MNHSAEMLNLPLKGFFDVAWTTTSERMGASWGVICGAGGGGTGGVTVAAAPRGQTRNRSSQDIPDHLIFLIIKPLNHLRISS